MNNYSNQAIVLGCDHHNTLGVLRSFGFKGVHPIYIHVGNMDSYVTRCRYIKKLYFAKSSKDAVSLLLEMRTNFTEKPVVIACYDSIASEIDLNYNSLNSYYILPGCPKQGNLTHYMNKEVMSDIAREIGLNVPETWVIDSKNKIENIKYPCIIKPILSRDGRKSDIEICRTKKELEVAIEKGSCYKYQVQTFIEKDFEYQLIGMSYNGGEVVIIPGVSRCIRPRPRTNTGYLSYEHLEKIDAPIELCKAFLKHVKYSGLFSMEFLRDSNGVDYYMETNFRNDGNAICVTKAGYNLPWLFYGSSILGGLGGQNGFIKRLVI